LKHERRSSKVALVYLLLVEAGSNINGKESVVKIEILCPKRIQPCSTILVE
jgi:hypothetical protein